jgi:hypothetical protein
MVRACGRKPCAESVASHDISWTCHREFNVARRMPATPANLPASIQAIAELMQVRPGTSL